MPAATYVTTYRSASLFRWFDDRAAFTRHAAAIEPMRRVVEAHLSRGDCTTGYCVVCDRIVEFRNVKSPDGAWTDMRSSLVCDCGVNGRMRMMYAALAEAFDASPGMRALLFERVTSFYAVANRRWPSLEGCEYVSPSAEPGSIHVCHGIPVRHEDMLRLSLADGCLDLVCHADVLEHVPDHRKALAECARVLAPGGQLLFTCPFFALEAHIVRARVQNGEILHLLPPGYHGNPMSPQGSLVFTHFGWPLLEDIHKAGFASVEIGWMYDPYQGIVSNNNPYPDGFMWPILFRAIR